MSRSATRRRVVTGTASALLVALAGCSGLGGGGEEEGENGGGGESGEGGGGGENGEGGGQEEDDD